MCLGASICSAGIVAAACAACAWTPGIKRALADTVGHAACLAAANAAAGALVFFLPPALLYCPRCSRSFALLCPPPQVKVLVNSIKAACERPVDKVDRLQLRKQAHQLADYCKDGAYVRVRGGVGGEGVWFLRAAGGSAAGQAAILMQHHTYKPSCSYTLGYNCSACQHRSCMHGQRHTGAATVAGHCGQLVGCIAVVGMLSSP